MTTNRFFHNASTTLTNEQALYQDLVRESIQIRGIDMLYIPRETPNLDYLFGEDPTSKFIGGVVLEMWCESTTAFDGEADFMSRFGLDLRDESSMEMSVPRFHETITKRYPKIQRAREGDLIWYDLTKSLFEITYVSNRQPFYQNGIQHVYKCTVKKHESSHEDFHSGEVSLDTEMNNGAIEDKHEGNEGVFMNDEDMNDEIVNYDESDPFSNLVYK